MTLGTVELFAGIGGFRLACDRLGIKTLWANDIDDKACKVYETQFGQGSILKGDIRSLMEKVPSHDILTAGFPCQPFSSAGKKQGVRDPRGTLFQNIVRIVDVHRPKYFVLENVKRLLSMEKGQHFATILDSLSSLGYWVEWRVLNAVNFGLPQNRERIFIVGHKNESMGAVSHLLSEEDSQTLPSRIAAKIIDRCKWRRVSAHGNIFPHWGIAHRDHFIACNVRLFSEKLPAKTLKQILQDNVNGPFDFTSDTLKRLSNSKRVNRFVNGVEIIYNQSGGARMGYTVFGINGVAPTLTSSTSRHYERYMMGRQFRKLTNVEYARLQGFGDHHCAAASVHDQYILYGNAVPPVMAAWVLSQITENRPVNIRCRQLQRELFQ